MDIIARIKHKLAYLQQHDDGDVTEAVFKRQFLIRQHFPYEIGDTHTETEIAAFEAEYHIRLPEDYRCFLMEVGRSVPSPGYHMHSPLWDMISQSEADEFFEKLYNSEEDIEEEDWWKEEAPILRNLDRPFLFNDTMRGESLETYFAQHSIASPERYERLTDGYLWLIDSGCTCWYILIITGEARGQLWHMDTPTVYAPEMLLEGELFNDNDELYGKVLEALQDPIRASTTQRVTFTQWYDTWLDEQIRIAQEHWHKRGRIVPPLAINSD